MLFLMKNKSILATILAFFVTVTSAAAEEVDLREAADHVYQGMGKSVRSMHIYLAGKKVTPEETERRLEALRREYASSVKIFIRDIDRNDRRNAAMVSGLFLLCDGLLSSEVLLSGLSDFYQLSGDREGILEVLRVSFPEGSLSFSMDKTFRDFKRLLDSE